MERLRAHDPRERLDDGNLPDFLLALEGVSHFVYIAHRARLERSVSAVELELQAEVDKLPARSPLPSSRGNRRGAPPREGELRR